jgi:hypothetical protein
MTRVVTSGVAWAGLALGPTAWAISTQANYALAAWVCAHRLQVVPLLAAGLALVSCGGALLSWRAWRHAGGPQQQALGSGGGPHHFVAGLGVLAGLLFALIILAQGAAGLLLDGCER